MSLQNNPHKSWMTGPVAGAAFLMATSAIGPGFITQTTVFTSQLLTSFGFVILISILLDIAAQLNIWRIIAVSGMRAQDLANRLLPGLGYLLTILVVLGGIAFNIGNVAGAGLGLHVLTGMDTLTGAIVSAVTGVVVFMVKEAGKAMDLFAKVLGFVMIALTLYVAFSSHPPLGEAALRSVLPEHVSVPAIITIVGGTVGGYISFAGAHRLLDAGLKGQQALPQVSQSSVSAILLASVMRVLLFLAALGIVVHGGVLNPDNPAASVFQIAAGNAGYKIFGVVLWSAAITSVVGSAYTSVSFLKSLHPFISRNERMVTILFIVVSTIIFSFLGQPVKVLILVGTLNGFILPVSLAIILLAAYQARLIGQYRHPVWMAVAGWIVVLLMTAMVISSLSAGLLNKIF